jgi:hypothetical protein
LRKNAPIRFEIENGSDGHADVIGMYLSQQYNIDVEFNKNEITKELFVFYLQNQR